MRPLALEDATASACASATFAGGVDTTIPLTGNGAVRTGTAPDMPQNPDEGSAVTVRVGCNPGAPSYSVGFVTRVFQTGSQPRLSNLQLQPTGLSSAPCTNGNPYYIPRDGVACQIAITATVSFVDPDDGDRRVSVQVGNGGAFDLTPGSGNTWTGTFTVSPRTGTVANGAIGNTGMLPVRVSASDTPAPSFSVIGEARIQAGRRAAQGPIANVVIDHYARSTGEPIEQITVTLRGLASGPLRDIDGAVDCASGTLVASSTAGARGRSRSTPTPPARVPRRSIVSVAPMTPSATCRPAVRRVATTGSGLRGARARRTTGGQPTGSLRVIRGTSRSISPSRFHRTRTPATRTRSRASRGSP